MADQLSSVLIYDGECAFCSAAARAVERIDDVGIIGWDEPAAQAFLEAQYEEPPFALVYVDRIGERVYLGRDAATELSRRAGIPSLVGDLLDRQYDRMAKVVQRTIGSGRPPADESGIDPLAAAEQYEALAAEAHVKPPWLRQ